METNQQTSTEELDPLEEWEGNESANEAATLQVERENEGQRLDVFLVSALENVSRSEAQRLIDAPDSVTVNGKSAKANYRLRMSDAITVQRFAPQSAEILPEAIPLSVIYEDKDVLVIDKPRGMVTHPAPGSERGTVVNAVLAHADDLSGIGGEVRPGIVHRLDKDTGGLLMIAKNDSAHRHLQAQIQSREAQRRYLALVWGVPSFEHATIDAPIGRHPGDRKKMAVVTDPRHTSRTAQTELSVRERFAGTFALLEAKLQTGRTHQIRVHCAYIQHPVVGDPLYGGLRKLPSNGYTSTQRARLEHALNALDGQALHAYSLAFTHPRTGERLAFTVPLPAPMQTLLDILEAAEQA